MPRSDAVTLADNRTLAGNRTLTDDLPASADPDAVFDAFAGWAQQRGLELYPAQEEALIEVVSGANVILSTPTGSGKSLVAAGAHFAALADGRRTFYTAPIKALVSEKFFALCATFGAEHVGMMTGDASVNADAPIICCTAEILANLALREGAPADVGQVVMDEFHFYADPDRGWAWQVPLLELPAGAVPADVGHARRRPPLRGRPHPPHRPAHRRGRRSAERPVPLHLLLRHHAAARDARGAAGAPSRPRSTSCTSPRPPRSSGRRR